jgi:hypothetical protein
MNRQDNGNTHKKRTAWPLSANAGQIRKLARQLWDREGHPVARNLEFYRQIEEQLLANRKAWARGGTPGPPFPPAREYSRPADTRMTL